MTFRLTSARNIFPEEDRKQFTAVRDDVLGPPDQRSPGKGGVEWERSPEAKSLKNGDRCYTLGLSFQAPKQLSSPMSSAKIIDHTLTKHQVLRKRLLQVSLAVVCMTFRRLTSYQTSANIAIKAIEHGLPQEARLLRQRAEACNVPQLGVAGNFYFPAMQLNLAPAADTSTASESVVFIH